MTYFKPIRRKIALLTLGVPCIILFGWVKSFVIGDMIYRVPTGGNSGFAYLQSTDGYILWWPDRKAFFADSNSHLAYTTISPNTVDIHELNSQDSWLLRTIGIGAKHMQTPWDEVDVWMIPYWAITTPLTVLSAYLLLTKPRAVSLSREHASVDDDSAPTI